MGAKVKVAAQAEVRGVKAGHAGTKQQNQLNLLKVTQRRVQVLKVQVEARAVT